MKTKNGAKRKFVSLAEARPDLAKEWNYEKNGDLRPEDVSYGSNKKVWWKLPYDVPDDYPVESLRGKHFNFEWQAKVYVRNEHSGCPYLNGHSIWIGFNDLQSISPELAKQWHPTKNGNLKPSQIAINADKKVWWLLPYDDPDTGKHFEFEWQANVYNRFFGHTNCPYISGQAVWEGFNDLQTVNPELAKQWHPTKNGNLKPTQVAAKSNQKVWWLFPYDDPNTGKHFEFEWQAIISSRNAGLGCPFISGKAVWEGFNDLQTVNPELAKQWHPTKNEDLKPTQFTANSHKKVWWLLPYDDPDTGKHFDFEWQAIVKNRNKGNDCVYLTGKAVLEGFNDLATVNPELAAQWHPNKNGDLKPTQFTAASGKNVWWLYPYDDPVTGKHFDFEWKASIDNRAKGSGCPYLIAYKGEEYIRQYLHKNVFQFCSQKKFHDLYGDGGRQLSYDFALPSRKYGYILIEYNGIQHYESVTYFGGESKFQKQKKYDELKCKYAKRHNYKLITIKYTYDTYEKVAEYLDKHLSKEDCKKISKKAA